MPNYSSRYMAIHGAADLAKAMKKPRPESPFPVGDAQLKAIRELSKIFDTENKIPNRDALPTPLDLLMRKMTELPRMEDHTAPPPRVDLNKEYRNREQKLLIQIQTTSPSEATRKKYTKKLKKVVKQRCRYHYTGNKYYIP